MWSSYNLPSPTVLKSALCLSFQWYWIFLSFKLCWRLANTHTNDRHTGQHSLSLVTFLRHRGQGLSKRFIFLIIILDVTFELSWNTVIVLHQLETYYTQEWSWIKGNQSHNLSNSSNRYTDLIFSVNKQTLKGKTQHIQNLWDVRQQVYRSAKS